MPDDHTHPTYEITPGFKPFTVSELFYDIDIVESLGATQWEVISCSLFYRFEILFQYTAFHYFRPLFSALLGLVSPHDVIAKYIKEGDARRALHELHDGIDTYCNLLLYHLTW